MTEKKNTAEHVETEEEQQEAGGFSNEAADSANEEADVQEESANDTQVLQNEVAKLQELLDEKENKILRVQADFENYKRRTRTEQETIQKYRSQNIVTEILPALDSFERALQINPENDQTESLLQGMQMVQRQLVEALTKEGVEIIPAVGEEFDPTLHQAVMQVEDESYDSNVVVEELQKGYKLKDRVIRPSMVKVNQ
ncbi:MULTISPECIES: nucleotide exchange factor GrpE [Bacillus]|uniref:Protein GrpE n=2 Tax=Bacillus TaxID=1386 RepID=A0A0M4FTV1_9BACI|nr:MULTISPECIES: nucleotide exchange factor GrpE [Bacillus]ALC81680.1 heat -hock protein GrpE [Bacillus gobiensis]MBP1080730.1 molecular chaperone GrpE [Bacillus capparidis]MED1094586.1 nucleotide exchange factor GrpE [Bacillus capparidis]